MQKECTQMQWYYSQLIMGFATSEAEALTSSFCQKKKTWVAANWHLCHVGVDSDASSKCHIELPNVGGQQVARFSLHVCHENTQYLIVAL